MISKKRYLTNEQKCHVRDNSNESKKITSNFEEKLPFPKTHVFSLISPSFKFKSGSKWINFDGAYFPQTSKTATCWLSEVIPYYFSVAMEMEILHFYHHQLYFFLSDCIWRNANLLNDFFSSFRSWQNCLGIIVFHSRLQYVQTNLFLGLTVKIDFMWLRCKKRE